MEEIRTLYCWVLQENEFSVENSLRIVSTIRLEQAICREQFSHQV